jgi:hypothetical protein
MTEEEFPPDNYPGIREVFDRVLDQDELPEGDIERVEVTCLASGEATYKVWAARAEEPATGYMRFG